MTTVPKEILNQHVAILGKTRSGKSSVMRLLVEGLLKREKPVCIVDPKGDWWGIKLAADGKGPGFPVVIFGGEHADVPINEHAGAHVAELFATGNRPCLIDLGGWMVGARTRFWIEFASTLFKLTQGERWLAVDEIHNFAPKGKVFDAEAGKALHWANRLASEGLGKGIAMLFASQRPQKVHNDTLTSAETLIAMRVLHPSDRGAVADWIKGCGDSEGSEVLNSLAQMERGEGWVWSPEIGFGPKRVKFPLFSTYDSFRAQSVEDTKRLKGWAEVDLDEVRAKLDAVVKEAAANDPRELKKQLASVRSELAKAQQVSPSKGQASPASTKPVLTDADRALLEKLASKLDAFASSASSRRAEAFRHAAETLSKMLVNFEDAIHDSEGQAEKAFLAALDSKGFHKILDKLSTVQPFAGRPGVSPGASLSSRAASPPTRAPRPSIPRGTGSPSSLAIPSDGIMRADQRVLDAVAWWRGAAINNPSRHQVAFVAGYTVNGHFNNVVGGLRSKGLIDYPQQGGVSLTEDGIKLATFSDDIVTRAALIEKVLGVLEPLPGKIFNAVALADRDLTREELAERTGYTVNGHFNNMVGSLHSLGVIDYPSRGAVRLAAMFEALE